MTPYCYGSATVSESARKRLRIPDGEPVDAESIDDAFGPDGIEPNVDLYRVGMTEAVNQEIAELEMAQALGSEQARESAREARIARELREAQE